MAGLFSTSEVITMKSKLIFAALLTAFLGTAASVAIAGPFDSGDSYGPYSPDTQETASLYQAQPGDCSSHGINKPIVHDNGAGITYLLPNTVTWCDPEGGLNPQVDPTFNGSNGNVGD
jgi:hypothetical protein